MSIYSKILENSKIRFTYDALGHLTNVFDIVDAHGISIARFGVNVDGRIILLDWKDVESRQLLLSFARQEYNKVSIGVES